MRIYFYVSINIERKFYISVSAFPCCQPRMFPILLSIYKIKAVSKTVLRDAKFSLAFLLNRR